MKKEYLIRRRRELGVGVGGDPKPAAVVTTLT
jgi:hypothetical protein